MKAFSKKTRSGFHAWLSGGGLRPVVVVALLAVLLITFPDRNFSLDDARAASSSPACATGVGVGGVASNTVASTIGGHGCVVIKYSLNGTAEYETFNYFGANQLWTVPTGVSTAFFYVLGAGGGGATNAAFGNGGGGGYATGSYAVTPGDVLTVIVGQAGGGEIGVSGTVGGCLHTSVKFGGGGQGGSCQVGQYPPGSLTYSSGGGRSAVRLANNSEIATAGGGGGGGYGGTSHGGAGGGATGVAGGGNGGGGGTQIAGGARGYSQRLNGTAGSAFLGGRSDDEGGGGGGGYFGGGGGGDNAGGGGGSSYVELLTNRLTTAGSGTSSGGDINSLATAGGVPSRPSTGSCSANNQIINYTISQGSDGGSPILNYEYHLSTSVPVSEPTTWTAFSPVQTVSPLSWDMKALGFLSGTSYKFFVRAVNGLGVSVSSWNNVANSNSNCTVSFSASAPGAPTSLTATAGSGSASVAFTPGSSNGAVITNYAYSINGGSFIVLSPVSATSPITVAGLTGGTPYSITLKAINSAGQSTSASVAVSVTPLAAAPSVSSVSGTSGTSAGGTSITITGTNFLAGATVSVGGAACTDVVVVSATSITCTTPAGTAGAQDIVVANTDSQVATLSSGFTYIQAPATPATPVVDAASDSGSSNSDSITSDNTPTISVSGATNGNTVMVTASKAGSASVTCTFTATAQSGCDLGTLADGIWSVTSTQTNSGVSSGSSVAMTMTVDTTRPTVTNFSSTNTDGTYVVGATINITATMSEAVENGASISVTLNTGDTVVLTKVTGATLTGTYTVGAGDNSSDLTVLSYVLTSAPTDAAGNAMTATSVPVGANNIAGAHAIVIDTSGPTLVSSSMNSAGTQLTLQLSEALNATTATPSDFAVTVDGQSATVSAVSVSGSTILLTLSPAAQSGDTVTVVYTSPTASSATSNAAVQDVAGNDSASFTSSARVPAVAVVSAPQGGTPAVSTSSSTTTTTVVTPTTLPLAAVRTTTTTQQRQVVEAEVVNLETTTNLPVVTLPNPLVPVVSEEFVRIVEGIGSVAGMAPDGWVKVEPVGTSSVVLTTSDGLRIEIAALTNDNKRVRLNSRGMVIVEQDDFITVAGGGLMPNSAASTWLFSTPRELGRLMVDENGNFSQQYQLGSDVPVGDHTAQINGIAPDGLLRSVEVGVEVIASIDEVPAYDPRSEPRNVVSLTAEVLVLLTVLGAAATRKEERESGDVAEVSVSFRGSNTDERNDLISPRAITALDRLSFALPARVVRRSPLVARVIADGAYMRALLGVWWLTLPMFGLVVGVFAAINTNYQVTMPPLALMIAIMVIGIADAFSGFIAISAFAVLAGINGGFTSTDSVRGVLGVWVLAFAVPLIGSAVRPFRRLVQNKLGVWERTTDVVLIALFGAWAAGAMFSSIPALTGFKTGDADQLDLVRLVALVALLVRYGVENLARIVAPKRLILVENQSLPEVSRIQQVASLLLRTTVFIFVALIFIGNNWALWIGGAMYLVPKLVDLIDDSFPDFGVIHRYMPRGILKTVMMLVVATWWGNLVAENVSNPDDMVQYGFVFLGIPGLILGAISWFGRTSKPWPSTALTKVAGAILLIVGLTRILG